MAIYPSFDQASIDQTLEAARRQVDWQRLAVPATNQSPLTASSAIKFRAAACISLTVSNGQVCLHLPLGIGDVCLPIPAWIPNGTVAQACLDICTTFGIPCGIQVSVSVAGQQIVSQHWGCNC